MLLPGRTAPLIAIIADDDEAGLWIHSKDDVLTTRFFNHRSDFTGFADRALEVHQITADLAVGCYYRRLCFHYRVLIIIQFAKNFGLIFRSHARIIEGLYL